MRLHYFPGTIATVVAITLEEAGLPYDTVLVDFAKSDQQGADYLAINPKGRVPALEVDGAILTETGAILEYLASCAPKSGLVPQDNLQAARMRAVLFYLASTMHVNHAHRMRGHRWANQPSSFEDMAAKVPQTMADSCAYVEGNCLKGPFVMGDNITLADPYLFVICQWLEGDGVDISRFKKLSAFCDAMERCESVKAVRAKGMLP